MTSEFTISVHALVFLNHKQTIVSSEELAVNVCTNPARVRKVMSRLKKAGLVETKAGIDGGYLFKGDARRMNLSQVAEAVGVSFVSASWRSGNPHMDCMISSGMEGVMTGIYEQLDTCCRKKLEKITIADIDGEIFGRGA